MGDPGPRGTDFTLVRNAVAADPGARAYAGAPPADRDILDLRGTPFAGLNPFAPERVRDVIDLSGTHSVHTSYDAHHDVLLYGVTLARMQASSFLF